jgi:hypothetical protein
MPRRRKIYSVLLQIGIWAVFLAIPYLMLPRLGAGVNRELVNARDTQPYWEYYSFFSSFALNVCLIIFFYIHQRYILTGSS